MSERNHEKEEQELSQCLEALEGLKAKILELNQVIEPTYNKEFWESFLKENGTEFLSEGVLLYLYFTVPGLEEEQAIEEDHTILKLHPTLLEIRKVGIDDDTDQEYHEVNFVPFHRIVDVSITTDYIKE
jgi:hypothetical protein